MNFKNKILNIFDKRFKEQIDINSINIARLIEQNIFSNISSPKNLQNLEFKCFSQFGDDGIISWLINNLSKIVNNDFHFYEVGCGNLDESNSKYTSLSKNIRSTVIDSNSNNISKIKNSYVYQKYDVNPICSFVNQDNINSFFKTNNYTNLLSLDIDGIDFWVAKNIDFEKFNFAFFVCEINPVFGYEDKLSVIYKEDFDRWDFSETGNLYGASIQAFISLMKKRNYSFIGTNSAGNNAYFLNNRYSSIIDRFSESKIFKRKFLDIKQSNNFDRDYYEVMEKNILKSNPNKIIKISDEHCNFI